MVADQDPNRSLVCETVLTARLAYVGKVFEATCAYFGLGPAGFAPGDETLLAERLLARPGAEIHQMAYTPTVLAKQA
eukprot:4735812-Alexandrium_andersonii.AAC.1